MKTTWYPLLKKVGAMVGKKVVKESVGKAVTKVVPVVGGAISGAITYATFKPMGGRLADVLVRNLNGEFDWRPAWNSARNSGTPMLRKMAKSRSMRLK